MLEFNTGGDEDLYNMTKEIMMEKIKNEKK